MTASVPAPAAPTSTSPLAQAAGGAPKGVQGAAAAFEAMMDAFLAGIGEPVAAPAQTPGLAVGAPGVGAAAPLLAATDDTAQAAADGKDADGKTAEDLLAAQDVVAPVPAPATDMTLAMAAMIAPPVPQTPTSPVTPQAAAPAATQTPLLALANLVPAPGLAAAATGVAQDAEATAGAQDDPDAAPGDLPVAAEPTFAPGPLPKAAAPSQGQARTEAPQTPAPQAERAAPIASPKAAEATPAPSAASVDAAAAASAVQAETAAAPMITAAAAAPAVAVAAPAKPAEPAAQAKAVAKDGERVEAFAASPDGTTARTPATAAHASADTATSSHADQGPVLEAAADTAPTGPAAHEPETTQAPAASAPSVSTPIQHAAASVVRGSPETVAALSAQILKKLEGRSTRFDLELHPADLGKVDVRVEIGAHGRMSAALQFDNPQAAAELKSRAGELQKALEQAGFDLSGGMSFDVAGDPQGRAGQQMMNTGGGGDAGAAFRGRAFQAALDTANAADAAPIAAGNLYLRRGVTAGVDVRI